jgi:O-antigen/teichoic acid export membrane protein
MADRVHKSILNAKVNLLFYFLSLPLAFFSRKIFLDCLGAEFIGLTGTLNGILAYLNLSELGIAACIGYFLYKPIQSGDKKKINEILSLLGYLYWWIGSIILVGGICVSLFFPIIFSDTHISLTVIYFAFYSILASALINYFINYRQTLLYADQKAYLAALYMQSGRILATIVQILLAYHYRNLYLWVGIEFLFSIFSCIILNWKINKEYPWLKVDKWQGRKLLKEYPEIIVKTKQVFVHKIKDFVLAKSDEIFIFIFASLKMIALYGNYMIIVTKLISLFGSASGGIGASVGNLVAEGNKSNMLKVFWEYTTTLHAIAATISFSIYAFLEPFIAHWLGAEYIIDHRILILICIYIYITNSRFSVDSFNVAHGLYADVWSAWAELAINVSVTIVCGLQWGLIGILMGKIASLLTIVVLWKPYYLFSAGFKEPVNTYWRNVLRNYAISLVSISISLTAIRFIPLNPYNSIVEWIGYASVGMIIFLTIELTGNLLFAKGGKGILQRIIHRH